MPEVRHIAGSLKTHARSLVPLKSNMAALPRCGTMSTICRKCVGLTNRFWLRSSQVSVNLFF